MSDFRPYFLHVLRGIAAGTIVPVCVRPAPVDPHFQAADLLFCVFDDAGELDYYAWVACGQEVATMDQLDEVEGALTAAEQDAIERALWAARNAHPGREADQEGYLDWIVSGLPRAMVPIDRAAELPPLSRGLDPKFAYTYDAPFPQRVPWVAEGAKLDENP